MKKLLILLTFIFAFGLIHGQIGRYPYHRVIAAESPSYPACLDNGHTLAWYDYTLGVSVTGSNVTAWADQSGNDNHLSTIGDAPQLTATGVLFDGTNDYAKSGAIAGLDQPTFIYLVLKQVSWTSADQFFDGANAYSGLIEQRTSSPNMAASAGAYSSNSGDLAVGVYGIVRILFNGASSKFIVNNNTPITGNFGAANMAGVTLGSKSDGTAWFGNVEFKEAIFRDVDDTGADESSIYTYLTTKYGL